MKHKYPGPSVDSLLNECLAIGHIEPEGDGFFGLDGCEYKKCSHCGWQFVTFIPPSAFAMLLPSVYVPAPLPPCDVMTVGRKS
jgi:hypothetical protein